MDWSRKLDLLTVSLVMHMPSFPFIALPERVFMKKEPERLEPTCIIVLVSLLLLETRLEVTVFTLFSMGSLELLAFGSIWFNLRSQGSQVMNYS